MERFVIIANGFQPLTIITKHSILDLAAALDPPLITQVRNEWKNVFASMNSFNYLDKKLKDITR